MPNFPRRLKFSYQYVIISMGLLLAAFWRLPTAETGIDRPGTPDKKETNGERSEALDMSVSDMASHGLICSTLNPFSKPIQTPEHRAILDALNASCAELDQAYGLTWKRYPSRYERLFKAVA
jgi:hypothetical protein